eukprot:scaffold62606_cov29-Phaeocystis_antarctica.AAC.2
MACGSHGVHTRWAEVRVRVSKHNPTPKPEPEPEPEPNPNPNPNPTQVGRRAAATVGTCSSSAWRRGAASRCPRAQWAPRAPWRLASARTRACASSSRCLPLTLTLNPNP